jgi:hypothetical protein
MKFYLLLINSIALSNSSSLPSLNPSIVGTTFVFGIIPTRCVSEPSGYKTPIPEVYVKIFPGK